MKAYTDQQGIRRYSTPMGEFPSVTAILQATASKKERDRLRKWQQKMELHGPGTADIESSQAKQRGTETHSLIEQYLKGEIDHLPDTEFLSNSTKPILKLLKMNTRAVELPVWHPDGYAGTLDLYAQWDDRPTIIDFTTSKQIKRKAWIKKKFLQCTAYAIAYNWLFQTAIRNIAVIVLSPNKCQIFEDEIGTYQHEWESRLNQFLEVSTDTELSSNRANCSRSSSVR
ncbi:MAG: hypothetical protein ABEI32_13740 [Halothece sp.]